MSQFNRFENNYCSHFSRVTLYFTLPALKLVLLRKLSAWPASSDIAKNAELHVDYHTCHVHRMRLVLTPAQQTFYLTVGNMTLYLRVL